MYRILRDYGSEGLKWQISDGIPAEYGSIDAAVKGAIEYNHPCPFLIVKVIPWEAKELS